MEFNWSRRRKTLGVLIILALFGIFYFQEVAVAGVAFMKGTNVLDPNSQRFNSTGAAGEKFWIQQSYDAEIQNLSRMEYYVTQNNGTEPPFQNELYDENRDGIYVDVVSGEPLFSSKHKFKSGTGWPSFYRPLEQENIIERKDPGPLGNRVEVASKHARSHLGHLFEHPRTPTGLRYCMNSASLEFIPADQLEERGYGQYSEMFD